MCNIGWNWKMDLGCHIDSAYTGFQEKDPGKRKTASVKLITILTEHNLFIKIWLSALYCQQ